MSRFIFIAMFAAILCRRVGSWRRVVGVMLIATLSAGMIIPPPVYAQFGILGGIQNIVNIINGAVRSLLNTIRSVSQSLEVRQQETNSVVVIQSPITLMDLGRAV